MISTEQNWCILVCINKIISTRYVTCALQRFCFSFLSLCMYAELLSEPWIFTKAKIQGALVGKDRFLQYYLISPGDVFDEAKHKHSVHTIEDELKREGYLHATVIDTVTYDEPSQTVKVSLRLSPGTSFTTGQVFLELSPDDPLLQAHLQKKLAQHL